MTSIQLLSVIACGALAVGLGLGGLIHAWLQVQPEPEPRPLDTFVLFDRMTEVAARVATKSQAQLIVLATRTDSYLWSEIEALPLQKTFALSDEFLHQVFLGCCQRALVMAANPYRGARAPATRVIN